MSLRAFGLGLSAAAAFSAVAVLEAPVQAATIAGQTLSFGGNAKLTNVATGNVAQLTFGTPAVNLSTNTVFGPFASTFSIADLSLTKTSGSTWELFGGSVAWLGGLDGGIGFTLETFDLSETSLGNFEAFISGFFTPSGLGGDGFLTAQGKTRLSPGLISSSGSSFSGGITAIPTPALLPGLLGLGVAAFRKRNGQDSSEQEA